MKKIINKPSDFVQESIDGLIKSHPDVYALAEDNNRVVTRAMGLRCFAVLNNAETIFQSIEKNVSIE